MFYKGNVQSAISSALTQNKSVICFVRDASDESDLWEHDWLQEAEVLDATTQHAVCLRLVQGSPEEGQLAAFYPLSKLPTLIAIKEGSIIDQLHTGTSKDEFILRLRAALQNPPIPASQSLLDSLTPQDQATAPADVEPPSQTPTESSSTETSRRAPNTNVNRSSKGKERATSEAPYVPVRPDTTRTNDDSYAQQQVRRKQEAVLERDRVRALIEADKQERKAREQRRREELHSSAEGQDYETRQDIAASTARSDSTRCGIQVRLLDGSVLRNHFSAVGTLSHDVRDFVDQHRTDGTTPYTFKLVRTPQPSRAVPEEDEKRKLKDIGLAPSASLALIPVKNLAQACQAGGPKGFLRSAPALVYAFLFTLLMKLVFAFKTLLGIGTNTGSPTATDTEGSPSGVSTSQTTTGPGAQRKRETQEPNKRKIRIRTLHDDRDAGDQQFYNGNQLNFEPKKDDDTTK